jgi:hypothetical protein
MEIISFVFLKRLDWKWYNAENWLRNIGARTGLQNYSNRLVYIQHDPKLFHSWSFRTVRLENTRGVRAIVGKRI